MTTTVKAVLGRSVRWKNELGGWEIGKLLGELVDTGTWYINTYRHDTRYNLVVGIYGDHFWVPSNKLEDHKPESEWTFEERKQAYPNDPSKWKHPIPKPQLNPYPNGHQRIMESSFAHAEAIKNSNLPYLAIPEDQNGPTVESTELYWPKEVDCGRDQLIAWWDYGSSITLADGETLTIDFDGTKG